MLAEERDSWKALGSDFVRWADEAEEEEEEEKKEQDKNKEAAAEKAASP